MEEREKVALEFIYNYHSLIGFHASYREIAKHLSISVSTAYAIVKSLESQGYVQMFSKTPRSLQLTYKGESIINHDNKNI